MCEIAVLKGALATDNADSVIAGAKTLYNENPHGIGFAAVYPDPDNGTFDYEVAKAQVPDWAAIKQWLKEQDGCWRLIIHARLATAGGKGFEQTHPIYVPDENIDTEWVIHNGVVNSSKRKRESFEDDGHVFNTTVDSEVIPHTDEWQSIPDDIDDVEDSNLSGRLNFLLLAEDKILIRNTGKYTITESFTMTCRSDWEPNDVDDEDESLTERGFMLVTPDRNVASTEIERNYKVSTVSGSRSRGRQWGGYGSYYGRGLNRDSQTATHDVDSSQQRSSKYASVVYESGTDEMDMRKDEADGYKLTIARSHINGGPVAVAAVSGPNYEPIEDANPSVWYIDSHERKRVGVKSTNSLGEAYIDIPEDGSKIKVRLLKSMGALDDDTDEQEDACTIKAELTDDEARVVDWWHHYDTKLGSPSGDGYCSLHNIEFLGAKCEDCVEEFSRERLLGDGKPPYGEADINVEANSMTE